MLKNIPVALMLLLSACHGSRTTAPETAETRVPPPVAPPVPPAPSTTGAAQPLVDTTVVFRLDRTPCFGTCPGVAFTVRADGNATYVGDHNATREGRFTGRLSTEQRAELDRLVDEADLFGMKDSYDADVTDLPSTWITVVRSDRRKRVLGRVGQPPAFRALVKQAEEVADQVQWTLVPGQE